jgi:serine/threonine protein kinase
MIGTVLNDRYEIARKLGKGAFGEVYLAHDRNLKRDVAVKILLDPGVGGAYHDRFTRESESLAKLMHPNIVTVFDYADQDGQPYIVMEFVDGAPLLDVLEQSQLELREIMRIGAQVCRALAHAHKNGIIHRDLTLRNVMVSPDGEVKVLDFGLVKLIRAETQTDPSVMVGTPVYLSPEQVAGRDIDERSDVFSFGVCMYRLLAGQFPFEAEHPTSLMYLIAHDEPPPLDDSVPVEVQDIVLKCLEKDPDNRYGSFDDVLEDIAAVRKEISDTSSGMSTQISVVKMSEKRGSKRNPYLNRVMIKNPADFFGRSREVKRIFSRLDAPRPQSISIVGERRVGKSSLLNFVYQRRSRRLHMENHSNSVFIFMDFQRLQDLDMPRFIDILLGMIDYEVKGEFSSSISEKTLDSLKQVVEELNNRGKRLIMLLDEFESITANPNFDMKFFSFLRYLANNFRVAYVTSSYNELQQMCHDKDIADSPFFNIFSNLLLRPFSREEAQELVRVPSERENVPLQAYTDRILELSGLFPMFVQIACSHVFEHLMENDCKEPDWNEITTMFDDEIRPHFKFIWDKMDEDARQNLIRVASGRPVDRKYRFISEDLERRGYLEETDGSLELFSAPFKEFVLGQSDSEGKKSLFSSLWRRKGGG